MKVGKLSGSEQRAGKPSLAGGKSYHQERESRMSRIYVQSEYVVPATPEEVYASLIDFQNARPSILTSNFVDYNIEEGGMGGGLADCRFLKRMRRHQ